MRLFDLAREQARRRPDLTAFMLLVPILLMAAALRGIHRADWDSFLPLIHPDEYHVGDQVTTALRVPDSFAAYLRSECPTAPGADALIAPQNPKAPLDEQYPSAASGCNSLNPRNLPWARTHVYGSLPTTLVRVAAELRYAGDETIDSNEIIETGRLASTWADLLSIGLLFLMGRRLAGRRVGLLAALLYAWTPFAIQQAHFFTVDSQAAAYGLLTLWFCLLLADGGGRGAALGAGVGLGLAASSKINMAALAVIVAMAALQAGWRETLPFDDDEWHPLELLDRLWRSTLASFGRLMIAGAATAITVRFAMPDIFVGSSLLDLRLDGRFLQALENARETASGVVDFPPSHQFANRAPWLYDWINMVRWGMGVPLGLAAWGGWAAAGIGLLRGKLRRWLPLWAWVGFYFWWQGGQPIKPMRYHLPIYGLLALFGAWALLKLIELGRAAERPLLFRRAPLGRIAAGLALAVTASTILWGWGYSRIYTKLNPRAAAADWARRNIPAGARISSESWDVGIYNLDASIWPNRNTELHPAGKEDSREKISELVLSLNNLDYVALTSNRSYGSLPQLPLRFPATLNYYRALFDGSLGFEQAADFTSFPSFLGIPVNDERADESWSVYDHPRVTIFRKTEDWSAERAYRLLTAGVNFEEIYQLKPIDISPVPTALQLPASQWPAVRDGGGWAETLAGAANRLPLLAWIVVVEILGLAAWGWLWRCRLPLPDRGLGLARIAGLLAFAWLAWLPGGLGLAAL
ncbi:MAG TPA: glycosyltransferase family 39 protein, partial [Herpetosiphonaceae bacterium]